MVSREQAGGKVATSAPALTQATKGIQMAQATEQNTIKSTHESMTDDSRGRSTVTRRLAMNMILGTAVAGSAIASKPAAAADDPIFALIEEYRAAAKTLAAACSEHS